MAGHLCTGDGWESGAAWSQDCGGATFLQNSLEFGLTTNGRMKKRRFTEEQIIGVLGGQEAGAKTADLCRKHGSYGPIATPNMRIGGITPAKKAEDGCANYSGVRMGYPPGVVQCEARQSPKRFIPLLLATRFLLNDGEKYE